MNPPGVFQNGERQKEYSSQFVLPGSGRRLPEFDLEKRRSIKDMFTRKPPSTLSRTTSTASAQEQSTPAPNPTPPPATTNPNDSSIRPEVSAETRNSTTSSRKRPQPAPATSAKRSKSTSTSSATPVSGQKTLKGFFKPKPSDGVDENTFPTRQSSVSTVTGNDTACSPNKSSADSAATLLPSTSQTSEASVTKPHSSTGAASAQSSPSKSNSDTVFDPIVSKEDWSKLFTKKPVPLCDSHQEPCISLTTKKPGMNRGRAFWICPRPLGPSGEKEKGTQWRCPTFIWASDWNTSTPAMSDRSQGHSG